ncbi:hypothetical protein BKP56_09205 [Marinilactibacillus sp. 15R]|uniref:hypothetical protein n=1 Tax=Marinilactibacillus sp. 15R TaxID=1911586 RepID=UPI000909E3E3|nr:hypothetical protein [Marinilactibacillus sp. 15R]API89421.1 hypothetical protein BKP56_09205 [Marinilactibacillus sp. 15R]
MNVNVDLGNFWEMLGSVSTTIAVILSLYLAFIKDKDKIEVRVGLDLHFQKSYTLTLAKNPYSSFQITEIGYRYRLKRYRFEIDNTLNLLDDKETYYDMGFPIEFSDRNIIKIGLNVFLKKENIDKKIRVYIKDHNNRVHYSNKLLIENKYRDS